MKYKEKSKIAQNAKNICRNAQKIFRLHKKQNNQIPQKAKSSNGRKNKKSAKLHEG
jgi:hypothetical protein